MALAQLRVPMPSTFQALKSQCDLSSFSTEERSGRQRPERSSIAFSSHLDNFSDNFACS
jgi:hypothetical protein